MLNGLRILLTVIFEDRTTILKCNTCKKKVAEIQYSWDLYEGLDNFDIICENCKTKKEHKPKLCYCGNIPKRTCIECGGPICLKHLWKT